ERRGLSAGLLGRSVNAFATLRPKRRSISRSPTSRYLQRGLNFARPTSQLHLKGISEIPRVEFTYEILPGLRERTRRRSCEMLASRLRHRICGASQRREFRPTYKKIR